MFLEKITFICSLIYRATGVRDTDKRTESPNHVECFTRPETRCECQARIKISLWDGFYYIYEFVPDHNHTLATGNQAHYLRSQRKITEARLTSIEDAKAVGISNKVGFDLIAKEAGGMENLSFTRVDMKNKLYSKRSLEVDQGDKGECWNIYRRKHPKVRNLSTLFKWMMRIYVTP